MEYIEMPEWKELKREKKYKEAADKLMYEIAVNLMMVHNKYSDVKYNPCKMCSILDYGKDSNDNPIKEMRKFRKIESFLSGNKIEYYYEPSKKTLEDYKEIFNDAQKIRKTLINTYNERNKENNW